MIEKFYNTAYGFKELLNPDFENAGRIHDWRNYVGENVRSIWSKLDMETRAAIALDAYERANDEDWD